MGESLNPSALSRLPGALRPDWTRTPAARRVAAGLLVVLAAVAALRPDPDDRRVDVVVAAHDLTPGTKLGSTDVVLESRSATMVPDGIHAEVSAIVGATLAGPARRGEALTDVRLLGPRLAESAAGPNARIVPLRLDDPALLELVRPGDVVDVLTADTETTNPGVVARDAVVVVVSGKPTGAGSGGDRVVLVALPASAADEVAAATLVSAVTLTFH